MLEICNGKHYKKYARRKDDFLVYEIPGISYTIFDITKRIFEISLALLILKFSTLFLPISINIYKRNTYFAAKSNRSFLSTVTIVSTVSLETRLPDTFKNAKDSGNFAAE